MTDLPPVRYFVVGAPKCASTSLYDLLALDSAYAVTTIKETHFFSVDDVRSGQYDDVPLVDNLDDYNAQYTGSGTRVDICPSYYASAEAIRKIADYNPDARILILVRDPIKRALSHFKMDVSLGYADAEGLPAIWDAQSGNAFHEYFDIGRYGAWIERWRAAFPNEQVFVANLVECSLGSQREALEGFLESTITADALPVSNAAKTYNLPLPLLRRLGLLRLADKFMPSAVRETIKSLAPRKPPVQVSLDSNLEQTLRDWYAAEYKLLGSLSSGGTKAG